MECHVSDSGFTLCVCACAADVKSFIESLGLFFCLKIGICLFEYYFFFFCSLLWLIYQIVRFPLSLLNGIGPVIFRPLMIFEYLLFVVFIQ